MTTSTLDPKVSPMMAQWHACKQKGGDSLLFFRLGDFYEAFYDDAILMAKELDLTLTKRQEIPMCGVPFHTCEGYIDKLIAKGFKVAVAEQIEDPKMVKGIVKREIVRIITPGTVVNSSLLSDKSNNFLVCLTFLNAIFGLAVLDLTTAEFWVIEFEDQKALIDELCRLNPSEIILSEKISKNYAGLMDDLKKILQCPVSFKEEWRFDHRTCYDFLLKHFSVQTLDGFGLKAMLPAINAAGVLLSYVKDDLGLTTSHIKRLSIQKVQHYMALDLATQRHLELFEPLQGGKKQNTLLHLLDQTETPMGGRLLKKWLSHPLLDVSAIKQRQEAIANFLETFSLTQELRSPLREIRDLERLIMRIETGFATPKDLAALRYSLEQVPLVSLMMNHFSAPLLQNAAQKLNDVSPVVQKIADAIVDNPPFRLSDGGIFRTGYNHELDELRAMQSDNHSWIARYQTELREKTQIKTLKVGFTRAFGYYIEVSRGQSDKIPDHFQRRQTLVNAERFITPELKSYEHKMLTAEERIGTLENELFYRLRLEISQEAEKIRNIAEGIAYIDTLLALTIVSKERNYICPVMDETDRFDVEDGRHPIVEASLGEEHFIPNDITLNLETHRLILITGPNMAGKSTFIRQVALIAILAQIGSYIPAKSAHLGIVDKVFTRIGASDDLSRGQSTFMVEMSETANILHNATSRSLVILDEIGRGTSTYDGISIAWAVAEYLLKLEGKGVKTLFATHYWELTQLEEDIPGAVNYNVAVYEAESGIVFLRKIVRGGTDKSYGIHVAKLAGIPHAVIKRSQEILQKLEKNVRSQPTTALSPSSKQKQLDFFSLTSLEDKKSQEIIKALKATDLDRLTPLEALQKMTAWKKEML